MTTIRHHKTTYGFYVELRFYTVEFIQPANDTRWTVRVYDEVNKSVGSAFRLSIGRKPSKQTALDFLKLALFGDVRA